LIASIILFHEIPYFYINSSGYPLLTIYFIPKPNILNYPYFESALDTASNIPPYK